MCLQEKPSLNRNVRVIIAILITLMSGFIMFTMLTGCTTIRKAAYEHVHKNDKPVEPEYLSGVTIVNRNDKSEIKNVIDIDYISSSDTLKYVRRENSKYISGTTKLSEVDILVNGGGKILYEDKEWFYNIGEHKFPIAQDNYKEIEVTGKDN